MCIICGDPANGQECDFCDSLVCDYCVIESEGISNDIFCSEDCARDSADN